MIDKNTPHFCKCSKVTRCLVHTHPSINVQQCLNALVEAVTEFDEQTNSVSVLVLQSQYQNGVFSSVTSQGQVK